MIFNRFADDNNKWLVYAIVLIGVLGLSYALYALVERRPKKMWVTFFDSTAGRLLRAVERLLLRAKKGPARDEGQDESEGPQIHPGWDYPRPKVR